MFLFLVGGWTNQLKHIILVKLDHFPKNRGLKQKMKAPPRFNPFEVLQLKHIILVKLDRFPKDPRS